MTCMFSFFFLSFFAPSFLFFSPLFFSCLYVCLSVCIPPVFVSFFLSFFFLVPPPPPFFFFFFFFLFCTFFFLNRCMLSLTGGFLRKSVSDFHKEVVKAVRDFGNFTDLQPLKDRRAGSKCDAVAKTATFMTLNFAHKHVIYKPSVRGQDRSFLCFNKFCSTR